MIAKVALCLSIVAVALSVLAFVTRSSHASSACGRPTGFPDEVSCAGNNAPPSKFGICFPITRENGVMIWSCRKG
jgi:hypothetical protein